MPEVMDSDDLFSLLAEVAQGIDAEHSAFPATALITKTRAQLVQELAEMKAKGLAADVPNEWSGGEAVATKG